MVLVFCLGLNGPRLLPCEAKDSYAEKPLISLDVKNEPLKNVLKAISKSVGHEITVSEGWTNVVLTVRVDGLELESALRRVIAALGSPSYSILTDRENRKTEIRIYADAPVQIGKGAEVRREELEREEAPLDVEVIPPDEEGQRGLTLNEFNRIVNMSKPADLGTAGVIPPEGPGDKGMTYQQVARLLERGQTIDRGNEEVIPPEGPGERGLTMAEVDKIIKIRAIVAVVNGEEFPP